MPLNNLQISKYRFTLQAKDKITLPAYKGSAFHGGFGHALKAISPTWFQYFYQPGAGKNGDWPKPFVILPPLDDKESYQPGEQFHCELTLFGEATQHYSICQAAIEYLGGVMGLGYGQGKFELIELIHQQPFATAIISSPKQVEIQLPTRLRLKNNSQLCKETPEFKVFFSRLIGRLNTLQTYYGSELPGTESSKALIEKSEQIKLVHHHTQWDDWDRFSGRQKTWMKFGGLLGNIRYAGDLEPFYSALKIGQWTHIGGKTTFGFGKYILHS